MSINRFFRLLLLFLYIISIQLWSSENKIFKVSADVIISKDVNNNLEQEQTKKTFNGGSIHLEEQLVFDYISRRLFFANDSIPSLEENRNFAWNKTKDNYMLKKGIFSDRIRLLFVAGLEGTGHHAISAMLSVCAKRSPPLCEVSKMITSRSMNYDVKKKLMHGLFGSSDTLKTVNQAANVKKYMNDLNRSKGSHLFFMGLGVVKKAGMMSYPNFNGKFKSLDHPDVYQLAVLAEQAGVDFRVIVLQRNGLEILKSVDRREFGQAEEEPKILVDNAAAMFSQLALLDRKFFHCLHYERMNKFTPASKNQLIDFMHPTNMKDIMTDMLKQIRPSKTTLAAANSSHLLPDKSLNDTHNSHFDYYSFQLDARLALINDLCLKPY